MMGQKNDVKHASCTIKENPQPNKHC